jgi:ribosomal protein L10
MSNQSLKKAAKVWQSRKQKLITEVNKTLFSAVEAGVVAAQEVTPVKTGNLREHWEKDSSHYSESVNKNKVAEVYLENDVDYADEVNYGGPQSPNPAYMLEAGSAAMQEYLQANLSPTARKVLTKG